MSDPTVAPAKPASQATQIRLLTIRMLRKVMREPAVTIPNLAISVFFLFTYNGAFGSSGVTSFPGVGGNYLNFILPVTVLFSSISGGAAGLTLVADLETGYFRRQLSMPLSRASIVLAAILLGAIQVLVQATLILCLGLLMGADPAAGVGGALALLGFALLWGMGFAGYSVATGLKTGNAQAAQAATFIFFPLMFLAPVFLPMEQLAGWIQAIAKVNPTTYMLEAMRSVMIQGWVASSLIQGLVAAGIFATITLTAAVRVARSKTSRA
jgi:ABC transporter DrrB family efflux protein